MATLQGKTAVVTGASSGIGKATARLLADEGSHVFIARRSIERLKEVARSIEDGGGRATVGAFDLHDYYALQAFVAEAAEQTGRLDTSSTPRESTIPAPSPMANWRTGGPCSRPMSLRCWPAVRRPSASCARPEARG